nr:hypothetical protein [Tanacetum cinerariifolium]
SSDKLFIPMPTLMSGLKIAFILSSEDQGLFRKVHGVSDSTSILHRLKPKKHMDLENFVMKYLKDLPATTILGITVLEDKYMIFFRKSA